MQFTDYHAKYIAHQLTRRCPPDSAERLAGAVASAQVDLNPHQIDAALFAFRSPLSKGALLAGEVGLGKTIEAGLVLSQKWAERKRRILVIVPSNLRTQWYQELTEKFFLPCRVLESKSYNAAIKQGQFRPFEAAEIVICSYQFAKSKAGDVHALAWDLVVIDEAHRLRNVYRLNHSLVSALLATAKSSELPHAEVVFAYGDHEGKITLLEPLAGESGRLTLSLFSVESLAQAEDHLGLEREIKEIDRQIKEARRATTTALTLGEKLSGQKRIKALEAQRNQKRRSLFDSQDKGDKQRDELIGLIEGKLQQRVTCDLIFSLRWLPR